jgi:hypothetical protein
VASQTLWRHETVAFGTALALWAWLRDPEEIGGRSLALGGIGLALAVTSRQQVLVLAAVMLCWLASRAGVRKSLVPAAIVIAALVMMAGANTVWFGGPLGALPGLEAIHPKVHGVPGPLSERPWTGAAGLLVSPSRGLLVFSPVLLLAGASIGWPWRAARAAGPGWLAAGLLLQFAAYAVYSVWWGGHTYGPRYLIDLLVPLAPFLAMGVNRLLRGALAAAAAVVLLVWSIGVAGLGAFVYPNEVWNTSPAGVDLHHERLWDVRDSQIARAIRAAPSPQNFNLFSRNAVRP